MRKVADCRNTPSVMNCTLTISGEEEEVVRAAAEHAVSVHGHEDTPQLRQMIRQTLEDERQAAYESQPAASP
jgi:predicted small metal-binding protein